MKRETSLTSAAQFEAIVSIAADAIISIDESHCITLFNQGAEEIFGYSVDEVLGRPLDILLPERYRGAHGEHIRRFAGSPTVARRMGERSEIYGLRKNGEEFPAEASISKLNIDGSWMFTVVLRDVSDRRRIEEEKSRLLELERNARVTAERAIRLRDEVLGVVSHDLRNPLSVISMCAQALESELGNLDPRVFELTGMMKESASWMQRLIRDLLDVASIDAGRLSMERKPSDPVIVLVRAVEVFEAIASEKSITLRTDVPERLPGINVDRERIIQVLSNLLGNALKFTPAQGTVTLTAAERGECLIISVADTGPGIPEDEVGHIFDRFWQSQRTANVKGTGLGLAIARGIVEAHGGRIWVESTHGVGTTFHFTLPLVRAESTIKR